MTKQSTLAQIPEYLQTLLTDLKENGHFLGFQQEEWLVRTSQNRVVAAAATLRLLTEALGDSSIEEIEPEEEEPEWEIDEDDEDEDEADDLPLDEDEEDEDEEDDDSFLGPE